MNNRSVLPGYLVLIGLVIMIAIPMMIVATMVSNFGENIGEFMGRPRGCFRSEQPPHEEIEAKGLLKLPANASRLQTAYDGWPPDCTYYISFEIPPADLDPFVKTTKVKAPLTKHWPSVFWFPPSETPLGWNLGGLGSLPSFVGGETSLDTHVQAILVDTFDPTLYKVYVIVIDRV